MLGGVLFFVCTRARVSAQSFAFVDLWCWDAIVCWFLDGSVLLPVEQMRPPLSLCWFLDGSVLLPVEQMRPPLSLCWFLDGSVLLPVEQMRPPLSLSCCAHSRITVPVASVMTSLCARLVWGTSAKHSPQRVAITHQVNDEDVVMIMK
jgi:hypothetical protein